MNLNYIFKHIPSGELLRLVKLRKSNINTFIIVNDSGVAEVDYRKWSTHPEEQPRLINGFNNLIEYKIC